MLTCSSAASSRRTRRSGAPCAGSASRPRRSTPRPRRRRTGRRGAAPRRPRSGTRARKWPPHDSRRLSASMHISSPSSKKSATRPARSRDWFRLSAVPSTFTLRQKSSRSAADQVDRLLQAVLGALHAAVLPHDVAELAVVGVDAAGAVVAHEAGRCGPAPTAGPRRRPGGPPGSCRRDRRRGSRGSCSTARSSRRPGPASAREAPSRLAPWSEKFASPVTNRPGIVDCRS